MRPPIFVRALTDEERAGLDADLRSSDAFVLRRAQLVLASARGMRVPAIAAVLGCDEKTVRQVVHRFNAAGRAGLRRGSSRPHTTHPVFRPGADVGLRALLHQSPRAFGRPTSLWTLDLLAQVCAERGLTSRVVSDEAVRQALKRLDISWKRAKRWITSPDPAYARKKVGATG